MTVRDGTVSLLPCPFCGGEPHVSTYETESLWSHDQVTYTKVSCDKCDIAFQTEPGHETQAIAAWNRRSVPSEPVAWDELARDQARGNAARLLEAKGWKAGDSFSITAMLALMVEFAEQAHTVTDRCGYPDCGCDHDARCGDSYPSPASKPEVTACTCNMPPGFHADSCPQFRLSVSP